MPKTEAQKRAEAKYVRERVKVYQLRFYPSEADIFAHFDSQPNKAAYLKELIRSDMNRGQRD